MGGSCLVMSIISNVIQKNSLVILRRRGLIVGKNFFQGGNVLIDPSFPWLIKIGDDVTLVSRVIILAHDASTKHDLGYTKIGKVSIGDKVFVGAGSIVLPGVTIGNNVIIAAGSVVSKDIPNGSVAKGIPARVTQTIDQFLSRKRAEMESFPLFGQEYTLEGKVSNRKKEEMIKRMKDKFGYII